VGSQDDAASLTPLRMAARALQRLSEVDVDVLMFSQSLSEHSLNLVVREQDQAHCLEILRREFENRNQGSVFSLEVKEKVATISVVGVPDWNETPTGTVGSIVSHAFLALGKHHTRVIAVAQAATEYSVSFCVPEDQVADTVRFLHRELGLEGGN
jgi:aspartokinase/homoserine dehydrogenase 1